MDTLLHKSTPSNLRKPFYSLHLHFHLHFATFSIDEVRLKRIHNFPSKVSEMLHIKKKHFQNSKTPQMFSCIFQRGVIYHSFSLQLKIKSRLAFGKSYYCLKILNSCVPLVACTLGRPHPPASLDIPLLLNMGVVYIRFADTFKKVPCNS